MSKSIANRLTLVRNTQSFAEHSAVTVRQLNRKDGLLLGQLLFYAYSGTIDDEGQTVEETCQEAEGTLSGKYGSMLWMASFIALSDGEERYGTSAAVVTDYHKTGPLLAFAVTHPQHQRQGLAAMLIRKSLSALHSQGIPSLRLVVTVGNDRAQRLYDKLGFRTDFIRD